MLQRELSDMPFIFERIFIQELKVVMAYSCNPYGQLLMKL